MFDITKATKAGGGFGEKLGLPLTPGLQTRGPKQPSRCMASMATRFTAWFRSVHLIGPRGKCNARVRCRMNAVIPNCYMSTCTSVYLDDIASNAFSFSFSFSFFFFLVCVLFLISLFNCIVEF